MLYSGSAGPFQIKPLIGVILFHLNLFETNLNIRIQILILPVFLTLNDKLKKHREVANGTAFLGNKLF